MTADEYDKMTESLKKTIERFQDFYTPSLSELKKTAEQFSLSMDKLPDMSALIPAISYQESLLAEAIDRIADAVKPLQERMPLITSDYLRCLYELTLPASLIFPDLSETLQAAVADSLRAGEDYIDDSQRAFLDEIDPGILSPDRNPSHSKWKLTFSDIVKIITILFSIAGFIIQLLPDDQLDELIEQNAVANEQRQALISVESEELALLRQIKDTNQQLLEILNQSDDLDIDIRDAVDRGDQAADLSFDADEDLIDSPPSEDDGYRQDDETDAGQD